jgi:hypothetical protein
MLQHQLDSSFGIAEALRMNRRSALAVALAAGWLALHVVAADSLSLQGTWRFALDPRNEGEPQQWFKRELPDRIPLPGTTDQAGKGYRLNRDTMNYEVDVLRTQWPGTELPKRADEAGTLVREWFYVGKAWYQRDLEIPPTWRGKHVQLRLERAIWRSRVWLDDRFIGTDDSLAAEHRYDLGMLAPGHHRLTVCVDNDLQHNLGIIGHSYGPETQSRWNGLVGDLRLVATDAVFLRSVQVFPDAANRKARVRVNVANPLGGSFDGKLNLFVEAGPGSAPLSIKPVSANCRTSLTNFSDELEIALGNEAKLWSEFNPALYQLRADLRGEADGVDVRDTKTVTFGLREVQRSGRHILVNGHRVFLRGSLDCCVYPKTAHPPMTPEEWLRVLGTIKAHGFNHVRFHSWCPPDAAFEAADRLGLYLQPETSFWVDNWTVSTGSRPKLFGFDADAVEFVRREIRRISDAYGNHPSFALFCIGNEFGMDSDWDALNRVLTEAKIHDPRRLYAASTARKRTPSDDFWLTHSTGQQGTRGVGPAHTDWDFSAAAQESGLPVIAHETGQRPVFPDYADFLPKFTGPLKPYNYTRLQRQLVASGLANQTKAFARASAKFQLVQYKAEHEAMLRTADYAGYQLLMLNDFTGQSEALVGVLDPFWESKGVVSPEEVRQWNSPTVPLARFKHHTWTSARTFAARIEVSHFGERDLPEAVARWSLEEAGGQAVAGGELPPRTVNTGALTALGALTAPLGQLRRPTALVLRVSVAEATNTWRLWVYPGAVTDMDAGEILVTRRWKEARAALEQGRRVLVVASGLKNSRAAPASFTSVYWSAGWWGNAFSSLGILCDPAHRALAGFPNDGHSDWQWQPLLQGGSVFDLTGAPAGFRPLVQAVPDFHFNRLLGLVFETRVGPGRLLVCGLNLEAPDPAAAAMKASLVAYANSAAFAPETELTARLVGELLSTELEAAAARGQTVP